MWVGFVDHMCCSWDCPNAKNISCVSGGRLVERGQILFQAEFVHKIAGVPTQCQADIRAKQTAGLLVFHRFPIGSGRSTAHTANKAKPTVPPIQQSWLQRIQNPTIQRSTTIPDPTKLNSTHPQFLRTRLDFFCQGSVFSFSLDWTVPGSQDLQNQA